MKKIGNAYATYYYPPSFYKKKVSIPPSRSIGPINKSTDLFSFNKNIFFVNNEGYIGVVLNDSKAAEVIFNSIFLSTSLLKYQVHKAAEDEFDQVLLNIKTKSIDFVQGTSYSARQFLHIFPKIRSDFPGVLISKEEMKIILKLARRIHNLNLYQIVSIFYQAYTQYQLGYYLEAYLLGWMTIESFFSNKVKSFMLKKRVYLGLITRIDKDWSIYKKMQFLKDEKLLSKKDWTKYDDLRKIRNRIIHLGYEPTKKESERCKNAANEILWRIFKIEGINFQQYRDEFDKL